ncbi:MAG: DUF4367 domain-containing protein [Frisingicoccus sp.]|uniref:DUF4367 domain-containing protein n=1 Tax=Frisingicoccus sp. TaxID=1918627 RepID=UPI002A820D82|nr:DUF4367 domain-containing protein [Frisingicoccus sp.]MDY4835723.1 DUF4367 domain-containing protein [Frisingicoccus sp.]
MKIRKGSGGELSADNKKIASVPKKSDSIHAVPSESVTPGDNERDPNVGELIQWRKKYEASEDDDLMQAARKAKAVDRFLNEDAEQLDDGENIPRVFSQDYEARKQKMLQTAFDVNESESKTHTKRRLPKPSIPAAAAAAIVFIFLAVGLVGTSADAMPEPVRVLVMQMQSIFSGATAGDISYGGNQATDYPKEILQVYEPTMTLDGYEVSEIVAFSKSRQIFYIDTQAKKQYFFQQGTIDTYALSDIEDIKYEQETIEGEYIGMTYIKNGQRVLQWQRDKYVFEISGDFDKDTLIMLAASVEPVEE